MTRVCPQNHVAYWKGGETYHIVNAMVRAGNQGIIAEWKEKVAAWARLNRTDPDAAAVNAWLPLWQVREIYSIGTLTPMWPALAIATGFTNRWPSVLKSASRLAHELEFHRLPHRVINGQKFFAVQRIRYWRDADMNLWKKEISDE